MAVKKGTTATQKAEILRRYGAGERDVDIARDFGLHRSCIRQFWHMAGNPPRKKARPLPLNEAAFATITPESAYWAGFLLADGCIIPAGNGGVVALGLAAEDAAHVEKFRAFLGAGHKIHVSSRRGHINGYAKQPMHKISVSSTRLVNDLAALGVFPRKTSAEEAVPTLAMSRDFWRGVVDGDGSVFVANNKGYLYPTIGLCGGGCRIIEQFVTFANTVTTVRSSIQRSRKTGVYQIAISGQAAKPLAAALYENAIVALDRKAAKAQGNLSGY